jgi:3-oxoacyl-[acyl-carrier-protein] synthase-3
MYHLGAKRDGKLVSWKSVEDSREWLRGGFFNVGQDARLLSENIGKLMQKGLRAALEKHPMKVTDLDWVISHHSSNFFLAEVHRRLGEVGLGLPADRVFSTLTEQGNIGSASAFFSLEALGERGLLKSGQKILLFVPESARFSVAFAHLTVV